MDSLKSKSELPRRSSYEHNMVAVKGKLNSFNKNRVMEGTGTSTSKSVGVRNFKVYAENDKVKPRGRDYATELKRKSVPVNSGISQVTATDSKVKGGLKNLERTKGKHDNSAMINIGRKVLADISNVRADASSTELHDGAKPVKTISKSITYSQRSSIGTGLRIASSSSSKPLMGKIRANLSQSTGDHHTLKKVDKNDVKVSSDYIGTRVQGRKSFNNVGRKSVIPLPPTRNSLPVLKRVNKVGSRDVEKEHAENPGKSKEKYGFSVKLKVGRRVLPPGSSSGSHLSRNQVSDCFIKTALGGQRKVDTWASSRKLLKPIVKPKVTISDTQTTSKSETIGASTLSKRKEEVQTSSSFAHKASLIPCEQPAQEELPSDCSSNLGQTASDIIARRKSERRKSYTSLLMTRSKLLKEHGEITKQDFLPNIYDDCNPLEVAEYVDEIYRYYWVMEAHHQPLKNYMEMQKEITPQMRGILVNWLIEVHLKFDLMQETLYLMVTLLDQYLSLVSIKKNEMQLVGLTALLLASKYEDFWHPRVTDLISISAESYTKDQMLGMESAILRKLKFRLNAPTPYVFMLRFLKAAQSDTKSEHLAFYLIELSLVEYEALNFKPSLLCAAAIYLARCTLHMAPAWTPLLGKHAHYEESQIRDCAESILRFHKAARPGMLKVTYEKFMRPDYSRVAAIKPLERLPL